MTAGRRAAARSRPESAAQNRDRPYSYRLKETAVTRLLDLAPRALERLRGAELVEAIRASEGRTIAAETIVATGPLLDRVSNPELVAAFGADIIVLNLYDVDRPQIAGMPRRTGDAAPDDDAATDAGAVLTFSY